MEFTFWSNFLWFMPLFWSIAFVAPKHPFAFRISRSKEMHLRVYLVVHVMIPTRLEQSLCGSITDHSYKYKAILKLRFDVTHQAVQSSCSRWSLHWCLLLIFLSTPDNEQWAQSRQLQPAHTRRDWSWYAKSVSRASWVFIYIINAMISFGNPPYSIYIYAKTYYGNSLFFSPSSSKKNECQTTHDA